MLQKLLLALVFIYILTSCSDSSVNNTDDYAILEPDGKYFGKTYNEYSIAWWQWALSMPKDSHPLMDNAPFSKNQPENIWFLGGTIGFSEQGLDKKIERNVTIPYGKAIFFPVSTSIAPASLGYPKDSLAILTSKELEIFDELYCEINGERIPDIFTYRFASDKIFSYTLPENNVFDLPQGIYEDDAYADGIYILIDNLKKQNYTLRYYQRQVHFNYEQEVIYYITVE